MSFSIVIPTHNRRNGVINAVGSLYKQTLSPVEVIIVDDGSDHIVSGSDFNFHRDFSIKVIRNDVPQGACRARNQGVFAAQGEWIVFLDDDDIFISSKLSVLKAAIESNPDVSVIYHRALVYLVNEKMFYLSSPSSYSTNAELLNALAYGNCIGGTPMVAVKRQALLDLHAFDESLPALQDYEMWIRLAKNNYKFMFLNEVLTEYRHISNQTSITKSDVKWLSAFETVKKKHEDVFCNLSERDLLKIRYDNLIFKAYLNYHWVDSVKLNLKSIFLFRKVKYCLGFVVSLMGPRFVFWLRAVKSRGEIKALGLQRRNQNA